MSIVDEITEQLKIGKPIFNELFKLSDKELREKLLSIAGIGKGVGGLEGIYNQDLIKLNSSIVERIITNEEPRKIEIHYWDKLSVDWMGISFTPEHGGEHRIVNFNKNFKL